MEQTIFLPCRWRVVLRVRFTCSFITNNTSIAINYQYTHMGNYWLCDCFHLQYMFGADLLVAPITTAVNNTTQMATKDIWFPKVSWIVL